MTVDQQRRVLDALAETQRFIDRETARDARLRPPEVQALLAFYVAHRARLCAMLERAP